MSFFLPFRKPSESGPVRRALKALGPTWLASPVRRVVQVCCLALFLVLFFWVCWTGGARRHAEAFSAKEFLEAEVFLALDPLAAGSAALASRAWVQALPWAIGAVLVCLVLPRAFCGFVCPFGALIDLFDWAVGKRIKRLRAKRRGWWAHLKYYVLAGALCAAACGVLLTGFVAAIPVLTRGLAFVLSPLQIGVRQGWHLAPPVDAARGASIALFLLVFALGLLRPRFWCRHVCPTGAVFSVANFLRVTERQVEPSCIGCGKCAEICPFDAVKEDFSTRAADCTFCQTCGGACPANAIRFAPRWRREGLKPADAPAAAEVSLSRRGFVCAAAAGLVSAWGVRKGMAAATGPSLVRPPGSIPEVKFLRTCVRCGECVNACPTTVLQPSGLQAGFDGLWTPRADADRSGCEPTCNKCGQVCPTGAIRALPLEEKCVARMGQAEIDERTCLPHAGREDCQLCVDQCTAAGYGAIEFLRVGVEMDEDGMPMEDSGRLAPVMLPDKCVGCGLCQTRCYSINVKAKGLLKESAIQVSAGSGKEDRIMTGSYLDLRLQERKARQQEREKQQPKDESGGGYMPDFLNDL